MYVCMLCLQTSRHLTIFYYSNGDCKLNKFLSFRNRYYSADVLHLQNYVSSVCSMLTTHMDFIISPNVTF